MKNWLIKELTRILDKWEVADLPIPEEGLEYFHASTITESAGSEWIAYGGNGKEILTKSKLEEGWFVRKIWHETIGNVWHTHWYLARKV